MEAKTDRYLRVILIGELSSIISTYFSRNFSIFHIFLIFFSNTCNLTNLFFLLLENFTNSAERLRISIYISNYFQTLGNYGKTLSDKNEP